MRVKLRSNLKKKIYIYNSTPPSSEMLSFLQWPEQNKKVAFNQQVFLKRDAGNAILNT